MGFSFISGRPKESWHPTRIILIFQNYLSVVLTQANFTIGFSSSINTLQRQETCKEMKSLVSQISANSISHPVGEAGSPLRHPKPRSGRQASPSLTTVRLRGAWPRPLLIPTGLSASYFRQQWLQGSQRAAQSPGWLPSKRVGVTRGPGPRSHATQEERA